MSKKTSILAFIVVFLAVLLFLVGRDRIRRPNVVEPLDVIGEVLEPEPVASFESIANVSIENDDIPWSAIWTFAEISNATYAEPDADLIAIVERLGATKVVPVVSETSHGMVASDDHVVVIAFRGSHDTVDWLTDLKIYGSRINDGRMHLGFRNYIEAIFDDIYEEALRHGADQKPVWVTGHSLGGAMAIGFAYLAESKDEFKATGIVTFGQPLTFTTAIAQSLVSTFGTRYIRIVHKLDPVARLIPLYRHAGARVRLTENGYTYWEAQLAFGAAKNAPAEQALISENDPELQPMSEEEFAKFQDDLRAMKTENATDGEVRYGGNVPILRDHYIASYLSCLKSMKRRNLSP